MIVINRTIKNVKIVLVLQKTNQKIILYYQTISEKPHQVRIYSKYNLKWLFTENETYALYKNFEEYVSFGRVFDGRVFAIKMDSVYYQPSQKHITQRMLEYNPKVPISDILIKFTEDIFSFEVFIYKEEKIPAQNLFDKVATSISDTLQIVRDSVMRLIIYAIILVVIIIAYKILVTMYDKKNE